MIFYQFHTNLCWVSKLFNFCFFSGICPICGQWKVYLQRHIDVVHEKIKNFFCDLCGYGAYEKKDLLYHMCQHLPPEVRSVKCSLCDYVTFTEYKLRRHEKHKHKPDDERKAGEKNLCLECNLEFKTALSRNAHILRKHQKVKNFHCDECGKSFFNNADLRWVLTRISLN